jgi:probable O-glycosylation ligase (exosortase A-associated)
MRDVALTLVFIPMLLAAMRYVHAGSMVWIWTALAVPTALLWGFAAQLPLNKVAVAAAVISLLVDRTKSRFVFDASFVLHTLFLLQGVIAYSVSVSEIGRNYDLLDRMIKIWVLACFMRVAHRDRLPIHAMVLMIALSLGLHGVLEGSKYVLSGGGHKVIPPSSLGDNNSFALLELMILPLVIYAYRYSRHPLVRLGFLLFGIGVLLGVIASSSRGALIGLGVLAVLMIVNSRRWVTGIALAGALGVALATFAPEHWLNRMDTISNAEEDGSFMDRVSAWKMNTLLALDRPLVGGGYSAMEDPKVFDAYRGEFGMLDFFPSPTPVGPRAAHSIYFEVLGDTGFLGLVLFLAMLGSWFLNLRTTRHLTRGDPGQAWAYDLAIALQQSLVVYLVSGAALSVAYFEIVYIELTLASVLRRLVEERAERRASRFETATVGGAPARLTPVEALLARRQGARF